MNYHFWSNKNLCCNKVDLFISYADEYLNNINSLKYKLNSEEIYKYQNIKSIYKRNIFLISRVILKSILGYYLNINPDNVVIDYSIYNKPFVKDSNLKFNLSHSGNVIILGFSNEIEIGVDVEKISYFPEINNVAEYCLNKNELRCLNKLKGDDKIKGFYNCWTKKEAFLKACGCGLQYPLKNIEVSLTPWEKSELKNINSSLVENSEWSLFSFSPDPQYICSAAIKSSNYKINLHYYK